MLPNTNKVKIDLPYGKLQPTLDWCERNCIGDWHYTEDPTGEFHENNWIFLFDDERDFVAFKIWKT